MVALDTSVSREESPSSGGQRTSLTAGPTPPVDSLRAGLRISAEGGPATHVGGRATETSSPTPSSLGVG